MDITKFIMVKSSIEMPKEQVIHDLALLMVKSKMETGSIKNHIDILATYASEVHFMKRIVEDYID
ncbi:hypothetical protein [Neobacillus sp. NPDC093127]|uniref:hypothetical protein n=1 Tax=Neobacillus sp. NPDC093127 TaxID=3364296 RepID=UPI0038086DBB